MQSGLSAPNLTPAQPTPIKSTSSPQSSNTPASTCPSAQPASSPNTPGPSATTESQTTTPQASTNTVQQSLQSSVIAGSTPVLPLPTGGTTTTVPPALVVNGQTIANSAGSFVLGSTTLSVSTNAQGNIVIAGQTLTTDGQAITVSGSKISFAAGAMEVVFGGTSTTKLGDVILSLLGLGRTSTPVVGGTNAPVVGGMSAPGTSALGTGATSTTPSVTGPSSSPLQFTGVAGRGAEIEAWLVMGAALGFAMMV